MKDIDTRACLPQVKDERGEPARCVIANHVRKQHPWAKHVSVGVRTIRVYDYRCPHNPEGKAHGSSSPEADSFFRKVKEFFGKEEE